MTRFRLIEGRRCDTGGGPPALESRRQALKMLGTGAVGGLLGSVSVRGGQAQQSGQGAYTYVRSKEAFLNDRNDIDPTGETDMGETISRYLEEYAAAGITRVYCDPGSDYLTTTTVQIPPHTRVEGPYGSTSQGEAANQRAQFRAGASNMTVLELGSKASLTGVKIHLGRIEHTGVVGVFIDTKILNLIERCLFGNADASSTGIKGGGLLYPTLRENIFSDGYAGRAMDFRDAYSSSSESTYYGINIGWIERNIFAGAEGALRVEGTVAVRDNDFEGGSGSINPAIEHNADSATGSIIIDGNYFEMHESSQAILIRSGNRATITNNIIYGAAANAAGSYGVRCDSYASMLAVHGNSLNRLETGIDLGPSSEGNGSFDLGANDFNGCTTTIAGGPVAGRDLGDANTTGDKTATFIQHPEGYAVVRGALTGGAVLWTDEYGLTLDLNRGNTFYLDMAEGGRLEFTNARYGHRFTLTFGTSTVTLPNRDWQLLSGIDETPIAGVTKDFVIDYYGDIREIGNTSIAGPLDHGGSTAGFFGAKPTTRPTALTPAEGATASTGDSTTDAVIDNMRARIDELEAKLKALGLIG